MRGYQGRNMVKASCRLTHRKMETLLQWAPNYTGQPSRECITRGEITVLQPVVSVYLKNTHQDGLCLPRLQFCGLLPPH